MAVVACAKCGAKNRVDEGRLGRMRAVCGRCGAELGERSGVGGPGEGRVIEVTDATFAQALRAAGPVPVLVDCWAEWCGPCRMLAPTLEQLAAESAGRYVIAKLNVDENPRTAQHFNVSGIPTMLLFRTGALVDQLVGLAPKAVIAERVRNAG